MFTLKFSFFHILLLSRSMGWAWKNDKVEGNIVVKSTKHSFFP